MAEKLEFHFSHIFQGSVWNMILVSGKDILVVEVRNDEKRKVSFSALDFGRNQFLWRDIQVSEPWWVNLFKANEQVVTLSKFENTNNPDSVSFLNLDLQTGSVLEDYKEEESDTLKAKANVSIPLSYVQGSAYFETVKKFVQQKLNRTPTHKIEYLENSGLIFISLYFNDDANLTNHLLVFDIDGQLLVEDKIGDSLPGLGLETFFLQSGYLFYVKNKIELVTYRIVY